MSITHLSSWDTLSNCFNSDDESTTPSWGIDHDFLVNSDDLMDQTSDIPTNDKMISFANTSDEFNNMTSTNLENHISQNARRCPNRIRKGFGSDGKAFAPDQYDKYQFETISPAFLSLRLFGYDGITLSDLCRVSVIIQTQAREKGIVLTSRNRAACRRKPCIFHWLDENWNRIRDFYRNAVFTILGTTNGTRKRGPKKTNGKGEFEKKHLNE
jgi:hypothetical protein